MMVCEYCHLEKVKGIHQRFCSKSCKAKYQHTNSALGFQKGSKPWNAGLNRETDIRVAKIGEKISKSKKGKPNLKLKGKTYVEKFGKERANEIKARISANTSVGMRDFIARTKGKTYAERFGEEKANLMRHNLSVSHKGKVSHRKGISNIDEYGLERALSLKRQRSLKIKSGEIKIGGGWGKMGHRADIGHFVRSTWEANIARILIFLGKKYEYESKNCRFITDYGVLILDFYLPEEDIYLDPKSYLLEEKRLKLENFIELYPEIAKKVFVIDKEPYELLKIMFREKISNWE